MANFNVMLVRASHERIRFILNGTDLTMLAGNGVQVGSKTESFANSAEAALKLDELLIHAARMGFVVLMEFQEE